MPKDKDRAINPAAAQRKAEKQRALKKSKAAVTAQRNERLAHLNPDRLQRQIDDLKELEASHGSLSQRDKANLADLERDLARIRKAKELLGDKDGDGARGHDRDRRHDRIGGGDDPTPGQVLGKRGRSPHRRRFDSRWASRSKSSSATDEDVRDIPMPRDTPPPIPSRRRRPHQGGRGAGDSGDRRGDARGDIHDKSTEVSRPTLMPAIQQTVYESKPVIRDLLKEAVGFVPNVVKRKLDAVKGGVNAPLMEADELDRLEKEGYYGQHMAPKEIDELNQEHDQKQDQAESPENQNFSTAGPIDVDDEMARFHNELRHVQIEEVEDEDG